jgi:ElaA protein
MLISSRSWLDEDELMKWTWLEFKDLTTIQLYALLSLRMRVFMLEQQSLYLDLDDADQQAFHLLGTNDDGELIAYARLFSPGKTCEQAVVGRIVLEKSARGQGLGKTMIEKSMTYIDEHWPDAPILVSAQYHLVKFYEALGFETEGEAYDDGGIMHVDMIKD